MLPRPNRLPASEITRAMKSGKRVIKNGITMICLPSSIFRFAFIVSTKVDKRATLRNRLRRIMSESVRHILPTLQSPVDAVIIGSKQLVGLDQKDIEKRVNEILHP